MVTEVFKDIKGYEGLYKISNLGNVKSLPKEVRRGKNYSTILPERNLIHGINNRGYHKVELYKNGTKKKHV